MSILMTLRIALKALNRNKMRTMLTMLGMIIGVGAVITMVALGRGAQATIEEQVKSAGTNIININAGNFTQGGVRQGQGMSSSLTAEDADRAARRCRAFSTSRPASTRAARSSPATRTGPRRSRAPTSTSSRFAAGRRSTAASSRRRTSASAAKVAVLGTVVAETLFGPDVDPTGEIIRIRNQPFKVIGVMISKGQGAFGQDQDDTVFAPYTTVQKKLQGQQHINNITVSSETPDTAPVARGHQRGAAPPPQARRPATRTTSRSARRKKSPACGPRRRGR